MIIQHMGVSKEEAPESNYLVSRSNDAELFGKMGVDFDVSNWWPRHCSR